MLRDIFLAVFNMSITASYIIAIVFLVRLIFAKKMPKLFSYALWGIVLLRLVVPFSLPSNFSVFNVFNTPQANVGITEYVPSDIDMLQTPQIDVGLPIVNDSVNSTLPTATPQNSVNPMQIILYVATLIWIAGLMVFLLYYLISCLVINTRLKTATLYRDNIFLSDKMKSPIVFGIIKPRIILPSNIEDICSETEIKHIIEHENVHIKRLDHITKLLSIIVLAVYWFNPLVWFAFVLSNKDRELACDERVMKLANDDIRAEYANSLVNIGTHKQNLIGSLAFGESNIKSRVKSIVNFKKPAVWISSVAVIIVAVIGVMCLTNSVSASTKEKINQYLNTIVSEKSVAFSSNPYDYVNANAETFYKIVAFGDEGRNIMLEMFENTTDDGLKEYIMAIACNTIKPIMADEFESGRFWYETYKKYGEQPDLLTTVNNIQKLYSYKTAYVGDNSAVGNIIANLPIILPNAEWNGMELLTETPPYEVRLNYVIKSMSDDFNYEEGFLKNAFLMLALIDNLDTVRCKITVQNTDYNSKQQTHDYYVTRIEAEGVISQDLRDFAKSQEAFDSFYQLVLNLGGRNTIIHSLLPEGKKVMVNSGMGWTITVPDGEAAYSDPEQGINFTLTDLDKRLEFGLARYAGRTFDIMMFDIGTSDENAPFSSSYYLYMFDGDDLIHYKDLQNEETATFMRAAMIVLEQYSKRMRTLEGVSMTPTQSIYPHGVETITVIWKNDTNKELTFGEPVAIAVKDGERWGQISNPNAVFKTIGYPLASGQQREHTYNIKELAGNLGKGVYRISVNYSEVFEPGKSDTYSLYCEFVVE